MRRPCPPHAVLAIIVLGCVLNLLLAPAEPARAAEFARAKQQLHTKIGKLRWIAYSPSTFNPASRQPLAKADVVADLEVLKSAGFGGLVTYGCSPAAENPPAAGVSRNVDAMGMCDIPGIAKRLGFEGVIVGVWDPEDKGETDAVQRLARAELIDRVCVGNEGPDGRYSWKTLREVMRAVRAHGTDRGLRTS
jgi:hypothetical protein